MVHVTFNEKVECHQYTPAPTENIPGTNRNDNINRVEDLASTNVQGHTRFNYDATFLKSLSANPLSKICPDVVKKGIEDGKSWAFKSGWIGNRSVFAKPLNTYTRPRRPLYPFYNNNQTNFVGANRDEMFTPLEPIGRRRIDTNSRNYQTSNYEDHFQSRNLMPDYGQRFDVRTSTDQNTNDDDAVPEWYNSGPTSRHDVIELTGFDDAGMNNENDKINQFGCVDGNTSGGANSGASSNNGSPPAKSTPAKVTPTPMKNDSQRNKRLPSGRSNLWQNNFDNRQNVGAPLLNEFFKNFPANQNKINPRGVMPLSVEDVESKILYERMKFRQMVNQMQAQQRYLQEPVPSATQILTEIDKIIRTSTDAVYKRPEVRILIKNIIESVVPPLNLMNLLKNPSTETHNREAILAAIKLYTLAKQNAITAMKTRTPTDAELRAHMDAILQDAIIKKRMENLGNELLKMPYQQGGRNFQNQAQSFHQMFPPNSVGRFQNYSQSDFRGQSQPVENMPSAVRDNNLNRWFSPDLLNKGLSGELPQIPINVPLRLHELENSIKQKLKGNEKDMK